MPAEIGKLIKQHKAVKADSVAPLFELNQQPNHASVYLVEDAAEVGPVWEDLESRCDSHFFHSWTWVSSWLELVLPKIKVYFYVHRRQGQVRACGLLTLCRARRRKNMVRTLQLQLNEYLGDCLNMVNGYGGLLMEPGEEARAWSLFLQTMQGFQKGWDEILLSSLPEKDYLALRAEHTGLAVDVEKTAVTWVKELPSAIDSPSAIEDALLRSFKNKSRQQLRQSLRAFAETGAIALDRADNVDTALQFFEAMREVHTARWQSCGEQGSFANPNWVAFHRRVIETGYPRGRALMLRVRCGDSVLGYLYGHLYGNRVYMHQTGFSLNDDNKFRPGHVSHFKAMARFAADGLYSYDFLPDREMSYKKFFGSMGPPVYWVRLKRPRLIFMLEAAIIRLRGRISAVFRHPPQRRKTDTGS